MKSGKNEAAVTHNSRREDAAEPTGNRLPTLPEATRKRGRKRVGESRSAEIRARLAAWKAAKFALVLAQRSFAIWSAVDAKVSSNTVPGTDEFSPPE
jgi:hypothetical protein